MRYTIRHVTQFTYDHAITESVMEVRMQPRSDGSQRCLRFGLGTAPASRVLMYEDHEGNVVHHFNIPGRHSRLTLTADALVACEPPAVVPESLDLSAWQRIDAMARAGEFWEYLAPSTFATPTPLLLEFARDIDVDRQHDPLTAMRRTAVEVFTRLEYSPRSTRVDSPIDEALTAKRGVCQDFAHIFIALARHLGVPCRYVSGYLFHEAGCADRSAEGATHAWAQVCLPAVGWVDFDPTSGSVGRSALVTVAVVADPDDALPLHGTFIGSAADHLGMEVHVSVTPESP